MIVTLQENGTQDPDDRSRFKITLTLTGPDGTPKPIYMGALIDYCRGTTQAKASEEMVVSPSALMS
jgi:hypothetical protein